MIKVTRNDCPASLVRNSARWTNDLLNQIQIVGEYKRVASSFKEKYNQNDVKEKLSKMYNDKCCYCESGIGSSSYEHIEHLKPKSLVRFHNLSFNWTNLHWCCQICNTKKSFKWNDVNPILDPTVDNIDEHLNFNITTGKVEAKHNSERALTLINHTQINRDKLIKARLKVISTAEKLIDYYIRIPDQSIRREIWDQLESMSRGEAEYSVFIKKLIELVPRNT